MKPKHKLFADIYLVNHNATQAALDAGYSAKSAAVQGCKMLHYPDIADYIASNLAKHDKKVMDVVIDNAAWKKEKLTQIINELSAEIDAKSAKPIISAIAELNKMEGHYSAEKVITTNLNIDTDLQKVAEESRKAQKVLDKYRSEY